MRLNGPLCVVVSLVLSACATTAPPPSGTTARVTPRLTGPAVIPAPASMALTGGSPFSIARATTIVVSYTTGEVGQIARGLSAMLHTPIGFPFAVTTTPADSLTSRIQLSLTANRSDLGDEGYELTSTPTSVSIVANRPAGLFHGVQTLRQLLPADVESEMGRERFDWSIPALHIVDKPRFAWRGAMLDVARHFFTVKEVQQYIDLLALYKMNVLHLHLSDDQGWRIAINSRPQLAAMGGASQVGGGPGGYYTQPDYQSIVRYAQERYITIVPEIDMPSHINAALVGYPQLGCSARPTGLYPGTDVGWSSICTDKEESYALIDDVVREISAMTPGPYFHIGGDEAHSVPKEKYIPFVERAQQIVSKYGKTMVGWEEIAQARISPTAIVQEWKTDSATAALVSGRRVIMSPAQRVYLDMRYNDSTELGLSWAGVHEVRDSYDWDPATFMAGVGESNVVGVEAPLWAETIQNIGAAMYLAMPRVPGVAEVGWTPQSGRDWENYRFRLAAHAPRWRYLGINYYRSPQIPW
jgi:hexosaminidase